MALKKFKTFKGVFVPSTNAILGTVLFLLLPSLTADVGFVHIILIIILAHTVTVATSFSLADCATNLNDIGGGGMYAVSKKSLGKSLGGSIGVQLYFAQALSIGFYCVGFAEPIQPIVAQLFQNAPLFQGTSPQEILLQKQAIASLVFFIFFIIVMVGADVTLKIQMLILFILISSILSIFISPLAGMRFDSIPVYSSSVSGINLFGNRAVTLSIFFLTFTQFFPAVTGIDAGVGMSGDLENPKKSLVTGTFYAIAITFAIYIISAFLYSLIRKDILITGYINNSPAGNLMTDILGFGKAFPGNIFGIIILMGILFATSSSALSCFMTAPRTAQTMTGDNILPKFLGFLRRDFSKKGHEPRFATLVTFFVGISIIWIGNINVAATAVGICFLSVYGWVNGSAFLERISGNPTFRPTSKGHWLISLYGFTASIITIMLYNWIVGIAIIAIQYIIFQLIRKNKEDGRLEGVWWGVLFSFITRGLLSLRSIVQGTKNWRPLVTAISFLEKGCNPGNISYLAELIASYKGLVNLVVIGNHRSQKQEVGPESFSIPTSIIKTGNPTESIMSIIQMKHWGGLAPNTILLEYFKKIDTVRILNTIIALESNILILKNGDKFKRHDIIDIWWRGQRNGNLMVMLAYIMKASMTEEGGVSPRIRIIRKIDPNDERKRSHDEMTTLLEKARLSGEVLIIPYSEEAFHDTVERISGRANLIMMGIPGNFLEAEKGRLFNLNEYFFNKEIDRYNDFPPILFVKSAFEMNLIEDSD